MKKQKELPQIVLILSSQFLKTHPRAGEPTYFKEKIEVACGLVKHSIFHPKLHTMRKDYHGWVAKIDRVNRGEAVLRVVCWSGEPYNSHWEDIVTLTAADGIGVQKIECLNQDPTVWKIESSGIPYFSALDISKNDGLLLNDFKAWFKDYDLTEPLAIIHFTKFRY